MEQAADYIIARDNDVLLQFYVIAGSFAQETLWGPAVQAKWNAISKEARREVLRRMRHADT